MASIPQFPYLFGFPVLPVRRVIAVDAGSHTIKVMLVEKFRGKVRILHKRAINLAEEGLLKPEELGPYLREIFAAMGDHPIALALPAHLPMSQLVDLPTAGVGGVQQLIERETQKNRDLHDSAIVYDWVKLAAFGRHKDAFWVTLARENDIFGQMTRLALPQEDVCEVSPSANLLASAWLQTGHNADRVVLVDIGMEGTLVTVLLDGQTVQVANFPIGGSLFGETVAAAKGCALETAMTLQRTQNFFQGENRLPALVTVLEDWRSELEKIMADWLRENPETKVKADSFRYILAGGAQSPGLLDHLNQNGKLIFAPWPDAEGERGLTGGFAVAFGAALQALAAGPRTASLLPARLREIWRQRNRHHHLLRACFLALLGVLLLLGWDTWQKVAAIEKKEHLQAEADEAVTLAEKTRELDRQLTRDYERLRPMLRRQQQTLDTLKTLALLEQARTNRNLWFVVFGDQQSYQLGEARFNNDLPAPLTASSTAATNATSAPRRAFIAELCINEEGENQRRVLGQVVTELKQSPLFDNVDTLPLDLRREVANPQVVLPDHFYTLALELVETDFRRLAAWERPAENAGVRNPNPPGLVLPVPGHVPGLDITNEF